MFGVYVTLDNRNVLDAQKVFVSMALINILKTPLSQLPFAISTTMQVSEFVTMCICWSCESCWRGLITDRFRLWFPWDVWESTCALRNWKWRTSQRPHPVLVRFTTLCLFSAWLNNFAILFNHTKSPKFVSYFCKKLQPVIFMTSPQYLVVYICGAPQDLYWSCALSLPGRPAE